jgi:crotonobetainyl-CoA:carnitine CoA-transferase CaiB-like acyl-CoA transferase
VYRSRDGGWLVVSGTTDAQVARVLRVIGHDTAVARERFGASVARLQAADELDALVAQWVATHDRHEVLRALLEARVPAAPVNDLDAVLADPHVIARNDIVTVTDEVLGALAMVAPAPRLGATPAAIRTVGPERGAHNAEVYGDLLGIDAEEVARLHETGAI